jgi:hypothetical protein
MKKKEIKMMDIGEFVENGYLQEANRIFFHPLGLAMSVSVTLSRWRHFLILIYFAFKSLFSKKIYIPWEIWDYREDSEGLYFDFKHCGEEMIKGAIKKSIFINNEIIKRATIREKLFYNESSKILNAHIEPIESGGQK